MKMEYFKFSEFDSPDEIGSGEKYMNEEFLEMIDEARYFAQIPFKINSGYRTEEHNEKVGGTESSSHLLGLAADIHCNNSKNRALIVGSLFEAGFMRIGIAETFIHVDNDESKVFPVIWLY
tara:strand:+ start:39 stop:401 length:363 start_codon:yes stop_codon:yes gene_type:complete